MQIGRYKIYFIKKTVFGTTYSINLHMWDKKTWQKMKELKKRRKEDEQRQNI